MFLRLQPAKIFAFSCRHNVEIRLGLLYEWCGLLSNLSYCVKKKNCKYKNTLLATNPTRLDPVSNPGRRGGKPVTNHLSYFFYLVCEAIGTAATPGLLCKPRMIVKTIVEKQMECRLAGETEEPLQLWRGHSQEYYWHYVICSKP
jgi:hypothetical protein